MGLLGQSLLAALLGLAPNLMFGLGTGMTVKAKSSIPAWAYILGSLTGFALGIFIARRAG